MFQPTSITVINIEDPKHPITFDYHSSGEDHITYRNSQGQAITYTTDQLHDLINRGDTGDPMFELAQLGYL